MKKMLAVAMAVVVALVFSAFTPASRSTTQYYYWDGDSFENFTGIACADGSEVICTRPLAGGGQPVTVLKSHDRDDILMYDVN